MAKGTVSAALICAVLIVVGLLPIAAGDDHIVSKEKSGPWANAETWEFIPPDYGLYSWKITNQGLKWMLFLVYDNSTGVPIEISREHIRFAALDAYPTGTVITNSVVMAKDRTYEITAVPNGPKGAYAVVTDMYQGEPPVAQFTATVTDRTAYVDASASYDVDGYIVSYLWAWGDGTTGEGMTAEHTYEPGLYVLVLTVVDDQGLSGSMSAQVFFGPGPPPVASFTWTYGFDWYTVLVNGSASTTPDGMIVSYAWDFGDGYTATGVTASHTYSGIGYYLVTLQVTDNDGLTDSATQLVPISPVIMTFTYTVSGYTVTVDAGAIYDPDGAIVSYDWDWGDGTTGSGMIASHTYVAPGTYTITLTVTYNNGFTSSIPEDVTIVGGEPPTAWFTYTVDGFTVSVDASASSDPDGDIIDYIWDWGDGSFATHGVTATHSYTGREGGPPSTPFILWGYVYGPDGSIVPGCVVRIENTRTGEFMLTTPEPTLGLYVFDLNRFPSPFLYGDVMNITAWGNGMAGYNESVTPSDTGYFGFLNVSLADYPIPAPEAIVTLQVYDAEGLTDVVTQTIVFAIP